MTVRRGEIYWVDYEPVKGSEQGGRRPALIVQNDIGNANSNTTVIVAMARTVPRRPYPFVVALQPADSGLADPSIVNCAQILTIQQAGPQTRLLPPLRPRPDPSGRRPRRKQHPTGGHAVLFDSGSLMYPAPAHPRSSSASRRLMNRPS